MRYQGRITRWNDGQGFGFITRNDGAAPLFFHISSLSAQRRPLGGELVTYEVAADGQGRQRAFNVAFVGERPATTRRRADSRLALPVAVLFLSGVAAAVVAGRLPAAVLGAYLLASVVAFVSYAFDKSAARDGRWRTPESTLHLLGLVGGWPGALLAQRVLRHKSRKASFQAVFWATVVVNGGGLVWLLSPDGASMLLAISR